MQEEMRKDCLLKMNELQLSGEVSRRMNRSFVTFSTRKFIENHKS